MRAIAAVLLAAAFLVPIDSAVVGERADAATCASANITVTPLSGTIFYADFSPSPPSLPNLAGHYTGYKVTNATGATLGSPYVKLSGFTGGVVGLASGESSSQPLGSLAAGAANTSYFYLSASSATAVSQTHTVSVYDRNPSLTGAIELCNTSATFTSVTGTTQAAANKVTIATATSNPPGLGAIMTMTVQGDTGTIGSGSAGDPEGWDMTPAAVASGTSAWNPGAYRLTAAKVNIDLDGTGAKDWPDYLHRTFTDPSGSARSYTITYTFVIVGTTSASTALSPIQYIASGTQIKHTDMSGSTYSAILPIQPISNTTTIAKTASPTSLTTPGGTVGYTVTATNSSGMQSATLDDFTDTPGVGATYVVGSSKFNGVTISDPVTSGSTLVWQGAFAIPAGTSRNLTYSMTIVSGVGTVSNSVIGHIGATVIDTTTSTADNVPATRSVTVAAAPTLNLTKSVGSRLSASDQFTVAIKNGASTVASATTSGAGTTASTGAQTLAAGTAYSLTDAMAAGSVNAIGKYVGTISCTNSASGSTTVLPTGSSAPFSLTPAAGDVIACSISNAPVPTVTLLKSVSGRIVSADQFTVAVKNGAVTIVSATTSGAGTSATTGSTAVTAGTAYTLTDVMAAGSTSAISQYTSQLACTNTASGSATVLPSGTGTSFTLTPSVGDAITCTYTNTAPAPRLTLVKSLSSRHDPADQFTVAIKHGAGPIVDASHTTSGVLLGGSTAATTLTAGTVYTLTDDVTAGSSTNADYSSSISCTNSTAGTGTTLPSGLGNSFSITAAAGDVISCTFDNRAKPRVTLLKSVGGRVNAADQFTVAITHGAVTDASATTAGIAVSATTGVIDLSNGTPYTLTDAMAAGSSSALSAYLSSISCVNTRSGSTTVLPSGSGTTFSLNPAFDDQITCTVTNTAKPHLTLLKSVGSRAVAADQFTVAIKNGASTVASATTAGAAVSATTGLTTLTSATTYTLTDAMAAGSTSVIGQYASSISCTNATGGSSTVLPTGAGTSFSVTPASGDLITCTITNTAGTATLGLTKTTPSTNVTLGNVITYTYGVTNTGSLPLTNVTVTDPMAGLSAITCAPAQGSTLASGATMSCTATYTVTQADVDAGSIINIGTVTGKDPSNNTITNTASKTVTAAQSSSLSLTKAAVPASGVTAGSVVAYTLSGKNTGTTTLHNVTVTDPLVGTLSCTPSTPATLAPNATISCTGSYTVTQANVDIGSFLNTATIGGLTPANNPVSATGTKTVTATQTSTVGLTMTASPSTGVVAGTVVTYTFTGTNTGTVTLHNVGVTDPMSGLSALSCTPSAPATLAPNATITCTATYTVTQANVDAGSYSNTATINALNPSNAAVTNTATKTVTAAATSTLGLTKTASPSSGVAAGSVVAYTITGTNTGVTTLHNVTVSDPLVGTLSCTPSTPATLAPNATITCTGNYTVTQANVDAGSFTNTATINGLSPTNAPVTQTATKTVTATQTSTLGLTKTASPNTGVVAGSVVTYTYSGQNTGTVSLHNVGVTDPHSGLSAITCTPAAPATLAPNATISCTATYTVTQADVDAGSILNTGTINGLNPANAPVTKTAGATVTPTQTSTLSLTKTAVPSANVVAGDVVTYSFAGRNPGTTTLHNVGVTDPMSGLSAITCTPAAPATLTPNATISCTATYTVTQSDVDAGSFTNTATISGLNPSNAPVTKTATKTVTANQTGTISLTKSAAPNTGAVAGTVVTYTFNAKNTGTLTLHNVGVSDPLPGLSAVSCTPSAPATLAPNATISCTATYTVTQSDVNNGGVANTATVNALNPANAPVTKTASASVAVVQTPALSVTKTASPNSGVVVGDVVIYTVTGTNTGTVTLNNLAVSDPLPGLSAFTCTPAAGKSIDPGQDFACTATYTAIQADMDAGAINNTATVDSTFNTAPVSGSAGATVTTASVAKLAVTKSANPNTDVNVGDTIEYLVVVENTGTVTVDKVDITDPLPSLSAFDCSPVAPTSMAPGDTMKCVAKYTVTQADVDAGHIDNTATASGYDPKGNPVSFDGSTTVTTHFAPSISLTKTPSPASGVVAGDVVTYSFSALNTGNVTLHNVTVTDPMSGLSAPTCSPADPSTLAPGDAMDCSATYTVTQADVDAGSISNTATVDALDPNNDPLSNNAGATVLPDQTDRLSLAKRASRSSGVVAGDTVTYTFAGRNTGTTTLHNVGVTDPMSGLSAIGCTPVGPATLAPNAAITCTATYTVTQANVDAGSFTNTATINGLNPTNVPVTQTASTTVTASTASTFGLTKTASPSTGVVAGDTVAYTITGTNTGATTLHNVTVTDPLVGAISCTPAAPATLAPTATITCTGSYTVTQADVDAGSFLNTATINGLNPANTPVTQIATKTVTATQTAALALVKSASPSSGVVAGDTVTYTFAGRNTGTVTLHNVGVTDPMPGLGAITCTPAAPATLAPNAAITCTATYTVTQADVDAGAIQNTATIDGLDPANTPVSATGSKTVTANQTASFGFTKSASPSTNVVAGTVVTYTFAGRNTGTTTLHNVSVTDPMSGLSTLSCTPSAPATLAPNATITCAATYTVTQANVDAGSFTNTATINGLNPTNVPVTQTASATVTGDATHSLSLTKTPSPATNLVAGDVVRYTLNGRNTGATTLHNVTVSDPMVGLSAIACSPNQPATLAPNATIACSATYTVTQADVDTSATIANHATIDGIDPFGNPASNFADAVITTNQTPALAITKNASPNANVVAGDTVTYQFAVSNPGTVTMNTVTVTDPLPGLGAITCSPTAPATLAPAATMNCSALYTVTQADVDAGSIMNTATVAGDDPSGAPITNTGGTTVTANQAASLSLTKTAVPNSNVVAGDVVTYTFTGTNTGSVSIHNATITDPMSGLSALSCTPVQGSTLAANATITCTATYTVTQANVDAGSFTNTATVNGSDPSNNPVSATGSATVTTNTATNVTFTKTVSPSSNLVAGDTATYTFTVKNTGARTLINTAITDPLAGLSAITCSPAQGSPLAPNATMTCSATYTVTQADVDNGGLTNSAHFHADGVLAPPVDKDASAAFTTNRTPALSMTKTAAPNTGVVLGDTVTYTFTGTNTGTVTLHGFSVADPLPSLSAITCPPGAVAPLSTISCTATYTVTQADVDAGSILNTATMSADDPSNSPTTATAGTTVTAAQTPALTLTKTASPNANVVAGTVVTYAFAGQNTGTVTLHNVTVTDPMAGLSAVSCSPSAPATLARNATINCTATYTVTQADVDAGSINNTATGTGLDPSNQTVTNSAGATVTADQTASISLTKAATPTSGLFVGDTVSYTMTATNTGAVSVHNVVISDPMVGLSALTCTPAAGSTLAANASTICTGTYTVTQNDVDAGSISNTATVDALDVSNAPVTDSASTTILAGQTASLALVKTATPNTGVVTGDTITYGFDVTNNGTVSVHNVSVADPMTGLSALTCGPVAPATLAPNATMHCDATYTVTQTNVNDGSFTNTATVTGLDTVNNPVSDADSATVTTNSTTSVDLTKRVSPDQNVGLGTLLTYTMTATNTGTTTLENARIIDPMTGLSALTCTPGAGADLAPGASMTCTATYTVTAADVTAGQILNDATVSGHNLNGQTVTHAAAATVPTASNAPAGGLTIDKKLVGVTDSVATWTITVANSGAATFPGPFTVTDALPTDLSYESVSGTGWNCTGTATITCVHAADLAAGANTTITVKTKIVGEKEITNVASLDVAGRVLTSKASFQPGSGLAFTSGGFAFTGSDAQRLGFLGLLGVLGGWFIMVAARKRTDDESDIVVE